MATLLTSPAAAAREQVNILLVDDRPGNLLALEAALGSLGQNLVKANSGEEALRRLLRMDFAVILLDVQMPGISGFDLAADIRRRPSLRGIPMIFLTAINKTEAHVAKGYELGAVDYIFKPLVPEVLRAKVSVFIELHKKSEEVRRQKEELSRLVAELHRSNEELERFAHTAAHDLKEPLRTLSGYLELIELELAGRLEERVRELLSRAIASSGRMQAAIEGLLAYARVTSKGEPFRVVDCEAVLGRALEGLGRAIKENEAKIVRDPLPRLLADARQMERLFQNLIANSLKFRDRGIPRIHVGAVRKGMEWEFFVADNGIGIDPKDAGRLFKLFQRLHSVGEYPGTGLGLAVCRKIVERHGGRIWVDSAPGKGATFRFTIPAGGADGPR